MKTTFEMCMVDKFKMRITDTTNLDDYLSESQEYSRPTRYKYKDTCTVDIITYKNKVFDSFITTHESALNEVYYTLPIDGNYTIHHLIMPTKEWVDYIKENQHDYLNNYDVIYYTDNNKIYKYTRTLVDNSIPNFPYKAKSVDSLDTDTNWYYIRQHSYFYIDPNTGGWAGPNNFYWTLLSESSNVVNYYKKNVMPPLSNDALRQWCFVKNGDRLDVYNRKTKKKLVYNNEDLNRPHLANDPLFIGWMLKRPNLDGVERLQEQYNTQSVFRLYRISNNQELYINTKSNESELSYFTPSTEEHDYGSDIITEQVTGIRYGNEYIEKIEEVDLKEILSLQGNEKVSLIHAKEDTFSICYLNNCFLNICQEIYNNMSFSKCSKPNSESTFNRDFVWMLINVIKYNLDLGYTEEAQRVLDEFNTCGNNICNQSLVVNYGCGCS